MKTLSSESILTLLGLRSKLKSTKKLADDLSDKVKKELADQHDGKMKDGDEEEFAPASCAFKFVLRVANRSSVGWRDEWYAMAVEKWGEEEATKRELKLMEDSAKKNPVESLNIEVNERYVRREKEKAKA